MLREDGCTNACRQLVAEAVRREQRQGLTAIGKQKPIAAIGASQVASDDVEANWLVAALQLAARGWAGDECLAP